MQQRRTGIPRLAYVRGQALETGLPGKRLELPTNGLQKVPPRVSRSKTVMRACTHGKARIAAEIILPA
jgi:hypothetical protein